MKMIKFLLLITLFFSGCIGKNSVAIKSKSPKASTSSSAITVSSVKVLNNQFVLTGTNLSSATSIVIKEGSTTTTLAIESQTSSSLIANSLANITLAAGKVFEFIVSSASASVTFTVDFSLCSSSLGGKAFDCTTTPNDKEVLSYDATSGKWKPRSVNGLSYQGVWDASSSLPTATTEGDYFIVSVASGSYAVGDWIVYNGSTFEKVSNSSAIISVFGRTGVVTATEADYVLGKMGDVDFTSATPTTNQVLKFNGTNWVGATLSTVETDPNVMAFAKTTLPTCGSSEVLKGNGTSLSCVTVSSGSGSSFSGTASRAIVTDGSGALAVSVVTSTELGYVSGVTSAIQTQISAFQAYAKTPIPTCNAGEVLKSNGTTFSCVTDNTGSGSFSGTANRAVVTDGTGVLASSAVTDTEIGYVSGVTSAIQTQLGNKQATIGATTDLTANSITTDSQSAVSLNPFNTGAGQTGELRFYELAASGSNYAAIKAPDTMSANYTLTLPTTPGTPGQVLSTTGSGVLGWIDNSFVTSTLTSGNIFVGSVGNIATSVAMSGDATLANTGALTIAANSVALTTDTTGNYVLNITASNGLQATAAAGEGTTPNLVLGGTLSDDTTINTTNTRVFKVQDLVGTDFLTFTGATGITLVTKLAATTADIDGGTLDNVSIGATTRAPASFTTVSATSAAVAGTVSAGMVLTSNILGGTTTTSGLTLQTTSGVGTTTADMHFLVGNNGATEALTILNNGNVGIGIATPTSKLTVNGLIESSTGGVKFPDGSTQTSASTGGILQDVYVSRSDSTTFAAANIPYDDTIPQSNEGALIFTQAITPLSSSSTLEIEGEILSGENTNYGNSMTVAVFEPTPSSDAIYVNFAPDYDQYTNYNCGSRHFSTRVSNTATTARTFMLRAGMDASGSLRLNGCAGSRMFGGSAITWLRIREISPSGASTTGNLTGNGTTNYIPRYSSSNVLNNSIIYDDGTNVGIGTTSLPAVKLAVNGRISSSVMGVYCDKTASTYTGSGVGGYTGAKAKCETACGTTVAHMCTNHEISISNQLGIVIPDSIWFSSPGLGWYSTVPIYDCEGWTNNTNAINGPIYYSGTGRGSIATCDTSHAIACCM